MSSNTTRFPHSWRTTPFNSNSSRLNYYSIIVIKSNWHLCMLHHSIVDASSRKPNDFIESPPNSPEQIFNIFFKRSSQSDPYLQSFINWRSLVHTQHLRVTTSNTTSIDLLPRITFSSRSPQVLPPRTTLSKEFRDTCRLNSTKARGFTSSLTEASLPALRR